MIKNFPKSCFLFTPHSENNAIMTVPRTGSVGRKSPDLEHIGAEVAGGNACGF